jgi:secreted trypsin-like serine protease
VRRRLVIAALAGALSALLASAPAHAIVGGAPAPEGRWPWMAAVLNSSGADDDFEAQGCGGTVIAPRRVLTAGHCVLGQPSEGLEVLIGRTRLTESGGRRIRVRGVSVFRGLVSGRQPGLDAAVLVLAADAGVAPVALPTRADRGLWLDGAPAWTIGWGRLNTQPSPGGNAYYADRLREVEVPVVGDDGCELVYGGGGEGVLYRSAWTMCAGFAAGGKGTCYGDSGGPLVVAGPAGWIEVGIVQGGDGCAEPAYYDLYVRADRIARFALEPQLTLQPESVRSPRVLGRLVAGERVRCTAGRWRGSPAQLTTRWLRLREAGALPVGGAERTHRLSAADVRDGITCAVTAANAGGSAQAVAPPLTR